MKIKSLNKIFGIQIFAVLIGILFIIEACTRPMLNTGVKPIPTYYTRPIVSERPLKPSSKGERIIPIERITSSP